MTPALVVLGPAEERGKGNADAAGIFATNKK
jgi:hypothetical protein